MRGREKMRSDYGLYGVALICFIIAVAFGAGIVPGYELTTAPGVTVTIIFLLIGIISAAVGYSARPRPIMPTTPPSTPTSAPAMMPSPPIEEVSTLPSPSPPMPTEQVSPEPSPAQPTEPSPAELPHQAMTPTEPMQPTAETPQPTEVTGEEKPKPARRRRKKAAA